MIKLEDRYIVLKLKDVAELSSYAMNRLEYLCDEINEIRANRCAEPIKCVVVEEDWPEYQPTVNAILTRVKNEPNH